MPITAHAHGFGVGIGATILFMGGHGCDIIGHGWAWAKAKHVGIWKGSLNELSFNAFEGKSTNA